ncbi:hypothetical protein [Blastomonas sp.]
MFTIAKLHNNALAAICALFTSALFIGLSVGPAEAGAISALII